MKYAPESFRRRTGRPTKRGAFGWKSYINLPLPAGPSYYYRTITPNRPQNWTRNNYKKWARNRIFFNILNAGKKIKAARRRRAERAAFLVLLRAKARQGNQRRYLPRETVREIISFL